MISTIWSTRYYAVVFNEGRIRGMIIVSQIVRHTGSVACMLTPWKTMASGVLIGRSYCRIFDSSLLAILNTQEAQVPYVTGTTYLDCYFNLTLAILGFLQLRLSRKVPTTPNLLEQVGYPPYSFLVAAPRKSCASETTIQKPRRRR